MTPMPAMPQRVEVRTVMRKSADWDLVVAGDRALGGGKGDLDRLRFTGAEDRHVLGIKARLPAVGRVGAEFDVARRLGAVVADDDGQRARLAGVSFAAEPAAFARQRQARLAEDRDAERQIRRCRVALGVHDQFVVAGWGVARQRHRGVDVLRFADADRNAGDLLAAISLGKRDLKILWRVGGKIDRGVAAAVVGDGDGELERGRRGAAQCRKVGRQLEFGRQFLADGQSDRQAQLAAVAARGDEKVIIAGAGAGWRFEPQLQLFVAVWPNHRCGDRLAAAKDRRLPAARRLRHRQAQLLRRQAIVVKRQIDRRGLAGPHGQGRVLGRQVDAGEFAGTGGLGSLSGVCAASRTGGGGKDETDRQRENRDREKPPLHP
jgi:hypothetical protein